LQLPSASRLGIPNTVRPPVDLVMGAENSTGGRTVFGIPSRDADGNCNVLLTLADTQNQFRLRDSVNIVVSEYGIANLKWRTIRERAQALIDIAHPDDRQQLIAQAKARRILYADQIFLSEAARFYPVGIAAEHSFKGGVKIRFRAIKPSDEASMRRLFYRFSDKSVFYRYLFPIKTMPHYKVQHYVNVDYRQVMSIVGIVGDPGDEKIIAEARFDKDEESDYGDLGFVVDENYQSLGIASYLYAVLVRLARERGLQGLKAEVLRSNKAMLNVFQRNELPVHIELEGEVYKLTMPFDLDELHPSTLVEDPKA
jgi:GNAT superfamily N-acetyltransferase